MVVCQSPLVTWAKSASASRVSGEVRPEWASCNATQRVNTFDDDDDDDDSDGVGKKGMMMMVRER